MILCVRKGAQELWVLVRQLLGLIERGLARAD
jgi:hypothetical protein